MRGFALNLGLRGVKRGGGGASLPSGALGVWKMGSYATSPRPYVPNAMDSTAVRQGIGAPARRNFANSQFWAATNFTVTDSNATGPDGLTEASTFVSSGTNWLLNMAGILGGATWLPAGTYTMAINVRWKGTGTQQFKMGMISGTLVTQTATSSWQRFSVTVTTNSTPNLVWLYTPDGTSSANFEVCNAELFSGSSDLGPEPISSHIYFQKLASGASNPSLASGLLDPGTNNAGFMQFASAQTFGAVSLVWTAKVANAPFQTAYQPVFANMAPYNGWQTFFAGLTEPLRIGGTQIGYPVADAQFDSQGRNVSTLCLTYDGSTLKFYVNGILIHSKAGSGTASAVRDFYFSRLQQNYYSGYTYGGIALYGRALSAAEVAQASSYLQSYSQGNGVTIEPTRIVFFEGDSITAGQAASPGNNSYIGLACQNASPIFRAGNLATGGAQISTLSGRASTLDAYLPVNKNGVKYVLHVLVGANDLGSNNAAAFTSALQTYLAARRAAGWDYIVCGTIISRTSQGDGGAQFDSDRATANTTIRGWVGTVIDACADYASNVNVGANGAANNTTYFNADKTHPVNAGYAQMYPYATAAINPLWGY